MISRIEQELSEIEIKYSVKIIYACESGSRAWGFASENSDYDVRFIYAHTKDWYLTIDEKRDVIEIPIDGDLDINGWDIRKSLMLLRKSNSPLLEWISSPNKYKNLNIIPFDIVFCQIFPQTIRIVGSPFVFPGNSKNLSAGF